MAHSSIQWCDNNTGYITININGIDTRQCLVYKPRYAIKRSVYEYLHYICREPVSIHQIMNKESYVTGPPQSSTESIFFNLSFSHPKIPLDLFLIRTIRETIHEIVYNTVLTSSDAYDSDIVFIVKIGAVRNWKQNCCICMNEKIGDPCGWGGAHCNIMIFRPCGHSICQDCFKNFELCPLCRSPIMHTMNHRDPQWAPEVIESLTNIICDKLKYVLKLE